MAVSLNTTEGCILECERGSGLSVHFHLVTFWWWLWSAGKKCSHPNPLPEQRVVCGTDRGHLALLCQLLQLVGFVLCFYKSLLHIFQCLDKQGVGGQRVGVAWRDTTPFIICGSLHKNDQSLKILRKIFWLKLTSSTNNNPSARHNLHLRYNNVWNSTMTM